MNKVLQAAGRVVRTPQDKGVVLLLDDRFAQPDTARLFPPHWRHIQYLPGTAALKTVLAGSGVSILALSVKACRLCQLSQRESLWQSTQTSSFCQGLSLWERWQ